MRSLPNLREVGSLLFSRLVFLFCFLFCLEVWQSGGGILASSGEEQTPPGGWQLWSSLQSLLVS